jgi:type IX secretion system PorP/SprF family membrane protein
MKSLSTILLAIMITGLSFAQDAQFSQFYAAPLYLNPAFAGTDSGARLGINFRNQWVDNEGQLTTYDLEYDQHVNALHGGFGVMAWKNDAGSGTISTTNFSGIYSFQQHIYKELNISIGIQGAYMQENLDWSKLTFNNSLPSSPTIGIIYPSEEVAPRGESQFFDLTAGIEGYTNEFYGGVSVAHITQPNQSFIDGNYPIPAKLTVNVGAMIPIEDPNPTNSFLSPNIIITQQQNFTQVDIGAYAQRRFLVAGFWYRNNNSFITTLGLQKWGIKIGYSLDLNMGQYKKGTYNANELSLGYIFHSKSKNAGFHSINTPSFLEIIN